MYISALSNKLPKSEYFTSTGNSMLMNIGKGASLPEMELEWKIPPVWNAIERNRARAYAVAYNAMVNMENWVRAMDPWKSGERTVSTPFQNSKQKVSSLELDFGEQEEVF